MKFKLAIIGAGGRMGRAICRSLPDYPDFELVSAIEREGSEFIGMPVVIGENHISKVSYSSDLEEGMRGATVVVDFSSPESSEKLADTLLRYPRVVAVCTTGLSSETLSKYKNISAKSPVLIASNTSLGVAVQRELVGLATRLLGPKFDVEIVESHHRNKKDAPSGTALSLAESICAERDMVIVTNRAECSKIREKNELGISSVRGGDVVGEHTVYFLGNGERLEVTHRASDRSIFARGVLELITILHDQEPSFYNPAELLRLLR
jgi:4-hydroxy-tetrahydrodipicolinate reductase